MNEKDANQNYHVDIKQSQARFPKLRYWSINTIVEWSLHWIPVLKEENLNSRLYVRLIIYLVGTVLKERNSQKEQEVKPWNHDIHSHSQVTVWLGFARYKLSYRDDFQVENAKHVAVCDRRRVAHWSGEDLSVWTLSTKQMTWWTWWCQECSLEICLGNLWRFAAWYLLYFTIDAANVVLPVLVVDVNLCGIILIRVRQYESVTVVANLFVQRPFPVVAEAR